MFSKKQNVDIELLKRTVLELTNSVKAIQELLVNQSQDNNPTTSPEEALKQKKFKNECNKNGICYICGKELLYKNTYHKRIYSCPVHGEIFIDYWE